MTFAAWHRRRCGSGLIRGVDEEHGHSDGRRSRRSDASHAVCESVHRTDVAASKVDDARGVTEMV
eukprot:4142222-Pleurochrysis_carterae.AAC.1